MPSRVQRSPAVVVAVALPVLLVLAVVVLTVTLRSRQPAPPAPDTGPYAAAPVEAPAAAGPQCAALLAALPTELPAGDATLPARPLADPAPSGVRAWAATPRPVVLRCGLPRPAELTPTSSLIVVDGVSWLQLPDTAPDPEQSSYVAVDRAVYVAVTTPTTAGSGPLQAVSGAIGASLPPAPIVVR